MTSDVKTQNTIADLDSNLEQKPFTTTKGAETEELGARFPYLTGGGEDYPYSGNGQWIIDSDTYAENEEIVLNGDLIIENGGNLTLRNVTLLMNCTSDGELRIEVNSGGNLVIEMSSRISSVDPIYSWYLKANSGSNIRIQDSTITDAGREGGGEREIRGLWINTTNSMIINCTIQDNYCGILLYGAEDAFVANNTILNSTTNGILQESTDNSTITGNNIHNSGGQGISIDFSPGNSTIEHNTVINSTQRGIYIFQSSGVFVRGNTVMNNSFFGIYL